MADNLLLPLSFQRLTDSSGNVLPGGKVRIDQAGTDTLKDVFLDAGLASPAANPIVADGGGLVPARYIGTGSYKQTILTADDIVVDTTDNLPGALDTSPFGAAEAIPLHPVIIKSSGDTIVVGDKGRVIDADPTGGSFSLALPSAVDAGDNWTVTVKHTGTAGAITLGTVAGQTIDGATSFTLNYKDEAAEVVCDGASYAVKASGRYAFPTQAIQPQGYLTLSSDPVNIVLGADTTGSTINYFPDQGNLVPLYSGQRWLPERFTSFTLSLVADHVANTLYDVYLAKDPADGTTTILGTGPAWGGSGAGSSVRGASAALARLDGLLTNDQAITLRNGATTYSIAANRALYLGTILTDDVAGQVTCHRSVGASRKWGVWNAYNRKRLILTVIETSANWVYGTDAIRPSNNDATNVLTVLSGLAEEPFEVTFNQKIACSTSDSAEIGIGWNSVAAMSGKVGRQDTGAQTGLTATASAEYVGVPSAGIHTATGLERAAAGSMDFFGEEQNYALRATWAG